MRGGEIFIPKIPSMRVLDLVEAVAPGAQHHIVGIRPGEKLHEVMISEDEARSTLQTDDRYIIEPAFAWWERKPYSATPMEPVREDFRYSSDTNTEWLDVAGMRELLRIANV
jgi:UDP-N-acetylglucosamine 4,6-dehydratase